LTQAQCDSPDTPHPVDTLDATPTACQQGRVGLPPQWRPYNVDQTGSANFVFAHDRPPVSCLSCKSELYRWLMPKVPGTTNSDNDDNDSDLGPSSSSLFLGGGSHIYHWACILCDDEDYERTRRHDNMSVPLGCDLPITI